MLCLLCKAAYIAAFAFFRASCISSKAFSISSSSSLIGSMPSYGFVPSAIKSLINFSLFFFFLASCFLFFSISSLSCSVMFFTFYLRLVKAAFRPPSLS